MTTQTKEPHIVHVLDPNGDSSMFDIPHNSAVIFQLGRDKHNRKHNVQVRVEQGADGTVGLRIQCGITGMTICPETGNGFYMTTLRRDTMAPEEPL